MSTPQPVSVEICDTCDQPWKTHLKSSNARAHREFERLQKITFWTAETGGTQITVDPEEFFAPIKAVVGHLDCIEALKNANRGPTGYPGPMGMTGASCAHK